MTDIVSIVLGIISVIQGMHPGEDNQSKIDALRESLSRSDRLFYLLQFAKQYHDEFQLFKDFAEPVMDELKSDTINNIEKAEKADDIEEKYRKIINANLATLTHFLSVIDDTQLSNEKDSIPMNIQTNIFTVGRVYEEFCSAIHQFESGMKQLGSFHHGRNYGSEFKRHILLTKSALKRTIDDADKLILNTTPILDYIHSETKKMLENP